MMWGYTLDTAVGCSNFNSDMQQQKFYEDGGVGTNISNSTKYDMPYEKYAIMDENQNVNNHYKVGLIRNSSYKK